MSICVPVHFKSMYRKLAHKLSANQCIVEWENQAEFVYPTKLQFDDFPCALLFYSIDGMRALFCSFCRFCHKQCSPRKFVDYISSHLHQFLIEISGNLCISILQNEPSPKIIVNVKQNTSIRRWCAALNCVIKMILPSINFDGKCRGIVY